MFYTTDQVAQLLGYKPETIRKKVRRGEISCFKIGSSICIPKEEVQKYLNNKLSTNDNILSNKEEIIEKLMDDNTK